MHIKERVDSMKFERFNMPLNKNLYNKLNKKKFVILGVMDFFLLGEIVSLY